MPTYTRASASTGGRTTPRSSPSHDAEQHGTEPRKPSHASSTARLSLEAPTVHTMVLDADQEAAEDADTESTHNNNSNSNNRNRRSNSSNKHSKTPPTSARRTSRTSRKSGGSQSGEGQRESQNGHNSQNDSQDDNGRSGTLDQEERRSSRQGQTDQGSNNNNNSNNNSNNSSNNNNNSNSNSECRECPGCSKPLFVSLTFCVYCGEHLEGGERNESLDFVVRRTSGEALALAFRGADHRVPATTEPNVDAGRKSHDSNELSPGPTPHRETRTPEDLDTTRPGSRACSSSSSSNGAGRTARSPGNPRAKLELHGSPVLQTLRGAWKPEHDSAELWSFVRHLRQKRGSSFRAWRLDIDRFGAGKVPYAGFITACQIFHRPGPRIWKAMRGYGHTGCHDCIKPLEFHEFDREEGLDIEHFARALRTACGFDMNVAWRLFDYRGRNFLTLEDFELGSQEIGFQGDVVRLFHSMDRTESGRLKEADFEYLVKVAQVVRETGTSHDGHVPEYIAWIRSEFGDVISFLAAMGFHEHVLYGDHNQDGTPAAHDISVRALALASHRLGFPGDAMVAITRLARRPGDKRTNSGTHVPLRLLDALVSGHSPASKELSSPIANSNITMLSHCRVAPSPRAKSATRRSLATSSSSSSGDATTEREEPRPKSVPGRRIAWNSRLEDFSKINTWRCPGDRLYFQKPKPNTVKMVELGSKRLKYLENFKTLKENESLHGRSLTYRPTAFSRVTDSLASSEASSWGFGTWAVGGEEPEPAPGLEDQEASDDQDKDSEVVEEPSFENHYVFIRMKQDGDDGEDSENQTFFKGKYGKGKFQGKGKSPQKGERRPSQGTENTENQEENFWDPSKRYILFANEFGAAVRVYLQPENPDENFQEAWLPPEFDEQLDEAPERRAVFMVEMEDDGDRRKVLKRMEFVQHLSPTAWDYIQTRLDDSLKREVGRADWLDWALGFDDDDDDGGKGVGVAGMKGKGKPKGKDKDQHPQHAKGKGFGKLESPAGTGAGTGTPLASGPMSPVGFGFAQPSDRTLPRGFSPGGSPPQQKGKGKPGMLHLPTGHNNNNRGNSSNYTSYSNYKGAPSPQGKGPGDKGAALMIAKGKGKGKPADNSGYQNSGYNQTNFNNNNNTNLKGKGKGELTPRGKGGPPGTKGAPNLPIARMNTNQSLLTPKISKDRSSSNQEVASSKASEDAYVTF